MAKNYETELSKKLKKIKAYIFQDMDMEAFAKEREKELVKAEDGTYFAVYMSVCDGKKRAEVLHSSALTIEEAWDGAKQLAKKYVNRNQLTTKWLKVDITKRSEVYPVQQAVDMMFSSYNEFFRRGISFDTQYHESILEAEANGNRLLTYKQKMFDLRLINEYFMKHERDVILKLPTELIFFDCDQYFIDDRDECYTLYSDGLACGRRITEELTQKDVLRLINTSSKYLMNQLHEDGSFDYGYYPIFHKLIPNYNILRHSTSIWSLVCAAELTNNQETRQKAVRAIKYMLSQVAYYKDERAGNVEYAYLVEKGANEIKLGGNAVAIILLTQYMKLYDSTEYVEVCEKLGAGILNMMNPMDGSFVHVLNYPDQSIKEEYRTVYYDGEAGFALARLYSLTKKSKWLFAAKKVVDHFIEADYTKYRDHWVAYAVNEVTMHAPLKKYLEFGLKNVQKNLEVIYKQPTSYHTYLELLTASFELYMRIKKEGHDVKYMEKFDEKSFIETIFHRAHHMLSGYAYPEYVMYFKKPDYFRGSFFVRHDGYRTRIDDVQHFCGAYYSFYKHYDELLDVYKELTGNERYVEPVE